MILIVTGEKSKISIKEKGITLIALVVTIIVLLILAGVSIQMLTRQNGILNQARQAKEETVKGQIKDNVQKEILEKMTEKYGENLTTEEMYNILKEYFDLEKSGVKDPNEYKEGEDNPWKANNFPANFPKLYSNEENYSFELGELLDYVDSELIDRTKLKIGDYINYNPESIETYSKDFLTETYTGASDNEENIITENLNWQILKIYSDGRIDLLGTPTSKDINFYGSIGYNNAIDIMNKICESLYSRKADNIIARSICLEDIEGCLTEKGNEVKYSWINPHSGAKYKETRTYKNDYSYYPNLYQYENGAGVDVEETLEDGLKNLNISGLGVSDSNKNHIDFLLNNGNAYSQASKKVLTLTETSYKVPVSDENFGEAAEMLLSPKYYWLASRTIYCYDVRANYGLRSIETWLNGIDLYLSDNTIVEWGKKYFQNHSLRPIVTLKDSTQIKLNEGSIDNKHEIIKY